MIADDKEDKDEVVRKRLFYYDGGIGTISWVDSACGEQGWSRWSRWCAGDERL